MLHSAQISCEWTESHTTAAWPLLHEHEKRHCEGVYEAHTCCWQASMQIAISLQPWHVWLASSKPLAHNASENSFRMSTYRGEF